MARQTRIRTKTQDGATEVLVLVSHPMETGQRVDPKTKEKIPAHFIQKLSFTLNGKEVAVVDLGVAVSRIRSWASSSRAPRPVTRLRSPGATTRARAITPKRPFKETRNAPGNTRRAPEHTAGGER